jgi:glycosyltransferase involved in cell wall biosynthesis
MTLSVIVANLNRIEFVDRCIKSYFGLALLVKEIELIVIDGGSTDGSFEFLQKYATKYFTGKDSSVYQAWNKGISLATGDWIFFLNTDDALIPANFAKMYHQSCGSEAEIIRFPVMLESDKIDSGSKILMRIPNYSFRSLISEPCYFNGYLFHKSVFSKVGTFQEEFKYCADQHFLWKCLNEKIVSKVTFFPAYAYLVHKNSLTLGKGVNFHEEEFRIAEKIIAENFTQNSSTLAKTWLAWEKISKDCESRTIRILKRIVNKTTTFQQFYSIAQKLLQKFTNSRILLSKLRPSV